MSTVSFSSAACARCRGTEVIFAPVGERAHATLCTCVANCPACGGSGRQVTEKDGALFATVCGCRTRQRKVDLYNRAGIPRHFCGKGFESFTTYEDSHKAALTRLQSFAEGYPKFGKGVLLWGATGTGKTHLLCGALQHLTLERGIRARYVEFSFLVSEIKEAFARNVSVLAALGPLADVEVLVVDELGKGRATEFEREVLDELISRRYNADRTTLFATNFIASHKRPETGGAFANPLQLVSQGISDGQLRERIGERTHSRLAEMAEFIHVNARDRRVPPG